MTSKDLYYVMTTKGVWEILRWKTEVGRMNEMGPKGKILAVVGLFVKYLSGPLWVAITVIIPYYGS